MTHTELLACISNKSFLVLHVSISGRLRLYYDLYIICGGLKGHRFGAIGMKMMTGFFWICNAHAEQEL